jgi:hypothetical protein
MWDPSATLSAVSNDLPVELFPQEQRRTLAAIASRVPVPATSLGFELRLALGEPRVDLGIAMGPQRRASEQLAAAGRDPRVAPAGRVDPSWRRILDFAERWADPTSQLSSWVPFIFLEYDADAATDLVPVPSIFVALDSRLEGAPFAASNCPELSALIEAAISLRGSPLLPALQSMLARCFAALPRGARILHLGMMLGRAQGGVRLSAAMAGEEVAPFLRSLGGEEAATGAATLLARGGGRFSRAQVDFDLDPSVQPNVGLGVRPDGRQGADSWERLIGEVIELGAANPERAAALLRWPGASRARAAGQPAEWMLHRELSHLKLAMCGGRLEAKAYLGVTPASSGIGGSPGRANAIEDGPSPA